MTHHADYDAIIVGSGFGGAMAAHVLVERGFRVLMLERGDWVPRGAHNWDPGASLELTPYYSYESPYRVTEGGNGKLIGSYSCVGGPSVFYGAVALRFRERDFEHDPTIAGDSEARWPVGYADLEPFYGEAERLLGVAGTPGVDPTEPWRSTSFPQRPAPLASVSERLKRAAEGEGLRPFPLPLAINYTDSSRPICAACRTCDTFACAIGAKNDLATSVLPRLVSLGMDIAPRTVALRIEAERGSVRRVVSFDKSKRALRSDSARVVVLAAGALGSVHLLLASGLDRIGPGGHVVGRYLLRHVNAMVFGFFAQPPDSERRFHKQLGISDFYFGDRGASVDGKLGCIQQLPTPTDAIVRHYLPAHLEPFRPFIGLSVDRLTGFIVMAEDQPSAENGVRLDPENRDVYGLPRLVIRHRYSARDKAARRALVRRAKELLRAAGALATYARPIKTFSHAAGTARAGEDPLQSALDERCCFRGLDNLYVTDASAMPTVGGVNPSLTISANALRVARLIAEAHG